MLVSSVQINITTIIEELAQSQLIENLLWARHHFPSPNYPIKKTIFILIFQRKQRP